MPEAHRERRRFHRIITDKPVVLDTGDGQYQGKTLDISLRGLLLQLTGDWRPEVGCEVIARVMLDNDDCCIEARGMIVHVEGEHAGIQVTRMDVDSASRLRRMVELNLIEPGDLERDIIELIKA